MNTASQIATIIGTGLSVWALISRILTRARRRQATEFLSRGETQLVSVIVGAFAALLTTILVLVIQHSSDLHAFNSAASSVESYGAQLLVLLERIAAQLGIKLPPGG